MESFLNRKWQDRGLIEKVGIVGGIAALFFAGRKIYKTYTANLNTAKYTQAVQSETETLIQSGQTLTYPKSNYFTFADSLQEAMQYTGTYFSEIYSIFAKMKNDLDILELNKAFGKRDIYFWGFTYNYTLPEALRDELSDDEITKLNKLLYSKKIKYRY